MKARSKRPSISVSPECYRRIKAYAQAQGITLSAVVEAFVAGVGVAEIEERAN